jgi:hypothetical protein
MPARRIFVYGTQFVLRRPRWAPQVPVDQWCWEPFDPEGASVPQGPLPKWDDAIRTNYRPSHRPQKVVLIFNMGVLNDGLLRWFRDYDLKYFLLDYE